MSVYKGCDTTIRIGDGPELEWKMVSDDRLSPLCGFDEATPFLVPEGYNIELLRPPSRLLPSRLPSLLPADSLPEPDPENFWSSKP